LASGGHPVEPSPVPTEIRETIVPAATPGGQRAAEFVTSNVPRTAPDDRVSEVWARLLGVRLDSVDDLVVLEGDRIVGMVRMEDLLAAAGDTLMADIMDPDPPIVLPGTDREVAAVKAVDHGERSLAVVDESGRFTGLIPATKMLSVLLDEHADDLARLGGFIRGSAEARTATEEPIHKRYVHRLPWLILGLIGSGFAALIVAGFEDQLRADVSLAFFLPGIVYLADAVGTQTETLIIRGLSVGVSMRSTLVREIITGVAIGATLALLFLPIGLLTLEPAVVAVVGLSLFSACTVATSIAAALPALLSKLGTDPGLRIGPTRHGRAGPALNRHLFRDRVGPD
jgi:magnesium transporter